MFSGTGNLWEPSVSIESCMYVHGRSTWSFEPLLGDGSILLWSKYLQRNASTKIKKIWNLFWISLPQVAQYPWLYKIYLKITVKCCTIKKQCTKTNFFVEVSRCRYLDRRSIEQTPVIVKYRNLLFRLLSLKWGWKRLLAVWLFIGNRSKKEFVSIEVIASGMSDLSMPEALLRLRSEGHP
jgi:hypothetical protein